VNTGWSGRAFGTGKRIKLSLTRYHDAIHSGALASAKTQHDPIFNLSAIAECSGVPSEILIPRNSWADKSAYEEAVRKLAELFNQNFKNLRKWYRCGQSTTGLVWAPRNVSSPGSMKFASLIPFDNYLGISLVVMFMPFFQ
jgi:phosphoenolpyruvate carboxykinase (ATP)